MVWVGVDALDAFADLDLEPIQLESQEPLLYRTRVRPDLFVVEGTTGRPTPCDELYVSTEGLARHATFEVLEEFSVAPPTRDTRTQGDPQ
jgi:hypothetical protein